MDEKILKDVLKVILPSADEKQLKAFWDDLTTMAVFVCPLCQRSEEALQYKEITCAHCGTPMGKF